VQVAASSSGGERDASLARERAAKVRDYLLNKGVQSRRIEPTTVPGGGTVALRLVAPPAGIERLQDAPPGAGGRVTPAPKPSR
jgi:hypothetical protein